MSTPRTTELPDIPRTIGGIAAALETHWQDKFWDDVRRIHDGISARMTIDDWWRQAVIDTAGEDTVRRATLEDAADLHLIELAKADSDGITMSHDEAMAVYEQTQVS
ncbi:hypothetical protein J1792_29605 [Streptomyces triculaminicus]|uniref:Uncharacterized protein n=2 Tax=Streptomyces TaxID=1883 RepID=A0A939FU82_9ACTN|nr:MULTISPECIES: hypothetical protein [Streptomyces]MBO0656751.1 hypothetical protein [Streptomyces triculaminicus]QSY47809.1 hypothetical protein J3S04_21465 [Streptomyces griseocarneus]